MTPAKISLHLVASTNKAKICDGLDLRFLELKTLDWSEPSWPELLSSIGAAS